MKDIAIVLLNWNGKKLLQQFLPSIVSYSSNASIYVIDNNSSDDSINYLTNNFPQVSIISLDQNYGFCQGYNLGLQQIEAKYYVLVNTDIEVTENWLDSPIKLLKDDPSIAICQPKIKSWKEKEKFEYAGAAGGYIDKLGYPFCRGRIFENIETDKGQYDDVAEIFWASGACLFIQSKLFHKVNGFDSSFFAHMEEIDLCWRIKNLGYKVIYTGASTVYHVGGATLTKNNPKKTYLNFRNSLLFLVKNLPPRKYIPKIISRLFLDGAAGLYFLSQGNINHMIAIIKAHFSFYSSFWKYTKKSSYQINTTTDALYNRSIVIDYFLNKRKTVSELDKSKFPYNGSLSEVTLHLQKKS